MCGIAGLYHLAGKPVPAHCLKAMCDAMVHRGPDDEGYVFFNVRHYPYRDEGFWVEKASDMPDIHSREDWKQLFNGNGDFNLALGHRRLAIIDLSDAGHQPMSNRANGIWVTYNGEIYNFKELRTELQAKGHHFFSKSDTEVIIHLYEEEGAQAIGRLNGIFSIALWDGRHNRLLLARDRYGAKPLYYMISDGLLAFASEIKALMKVEGMTPRLDFRALGDYFTFQNTFGDTTLFEDVRLLEAGHYLVVEGESISEHEYYDYNFDEEEDRGEEFYVERLRELFGAAVERQLMSDVPVGCYLSGGLDSGSITAFASKNIPRLMTFTGGFDVATAVSIENFFDEREKAELISREFGTEHYQMVIHAGDLEWALPRVVRATEDLRVGMSYPHYYLSQLAGKFVKVVLAGPGGDETLGGYPWRYAHVRYCRSEAEFERVFYGYWSRLIKDDDRSRFYSPSTAQTVGHYSPIESFRQVLSKYDRGDFLRRVLYFEARTFLHGILVVEDKLSMAHSLESRVPFLDNELVDFTTGIPTRHLINNSWLGAAATDINLSGKYIFRQAMKSILPQEIVENRKQGFSAPDQSWYMQKLMEYIRGLVLSPRSLDRGYFQPEFIERILEEHVSGRVNHRLLIWSLMSFEWWNRIFIDGEQIDGPPRTKITLRRRRSDRMKRQTVSADARYR